MALPFQYVADQLIVMFWEPMAIATAVLLAVIVTPPPLLLEGVAELELVAELLLEEVALLLDSLEELLPPVLELLPVLELEPPMELELFESLLEVPSSLEELAGSGSLALEELTVTSPELEDWSSLALEVPGV